MSDLRVKLVVDVPGLYKHCAHTLHHLSVGGRSTGGIFGTVKTVDALCRRFKPETVIACWANGSGQQRDGNVFLAQSQDAIDISRWASARGFHLAWLKNGATEETIAKVVTDLGSTDRDPDLRLVVHSWNERLRELMGDKRVSLVSKSGDPLYEQEDFVSEHGFSPGRLTRNRQFLDGDLAVVAPRPNAKELRVFLGEMRFKSILKEMDEGKVRVIERPTGLTL